jgi:hypothetical protein
LSRLCWRAAAGEAQICAACTYPASSNTPAQRTASAEGDREHDTLIRLPTRIWLDASPPTSGEWDCVISPEL